MLRLALIALLTTATLHAAGTGTDFSRDVYPVLQRACFECHGPEHHKADLRLDTASPQHLKIGTDLLRRVALPKEDKDAMPKRGDRLTPTEIHHLRDWIQSGAQWPDKLETLQHWSYIPPQRPALPAIKNQAWPKNEIDHFILAKLEANNLTPSPPASPEILIRRLSLDLTGLPPTPSEVEAFSKAYIQDPASSIEHLATRLLASSPQTSSAFAGPAPGSISPATPTPTASSAMTSARSGPGAIGWSMPSTPTCHSISSPSNKSPAIFSPTPRPRK